MGFNIKTLEYNGLNLNLWDVGGQKSIRTYWRNYFEQTDGIIWVVDSVDRWRLEECKAHLKDLLSQEVTKCHDKKPATPATFHSPIPINISLFTEPHSQKLAGSSLLIFANKQDLGGALGFEQIAEFLDLRSDDISGRHWKILGCSAMTSAGLSEGFDWLVEDISSRIFVMA